MSKHPTPKTGSAAFDSSQYVRDVRSQAHREVRYRLMWMRAEALECPIETAIHYADPDVGITTTSVTKIVNGEAGGMLSDRTVHEGAGAGPPLPYPV